MQAISRIPSRRLLRGGSLPKLARGTRRRAQQGHAILARTRLLHTVEPGKSTRLTAAGRELDRRTASREPSVWFGPTSLSDTCASGRVRLPLRSERLSLRSMFSWSASARGGFSSRVHNENFARYPLPIGLTLREHAPRHLTGVHLFIVYGD